MRYWNCRKERRRCTTLIAVCIPAMRYWNNIFNKCWIVLKCVFVSRLWGIETSEWFEKYKELDSASLYPGYEVLKHLIEKKTFSSGFSFVSRLWGIETDWFLDPIYGKESKVCIPAMRYWNIVIFPFLIIVFSSVCIPPMRYWNLSQMLLS